MAVELNTARDIVILVDYQVDFIGFEYPFHFFRKTHFNAEGLNEIFHKQ